MTTQEEPRRPSSLMVSVLTALIVLTYVAFWFASPAQQDWATYAFALIPERFQAQGEYHFNAWYDALGPIFGHTLLHASWWHAGLNAFFLYAAGRFAAVRLGPWRFLALYLVSAAVGALVFVLFNWESGAIAIGASDAVCGVFMAYFLSVRPSWWESLAIPGVRNQLVMIILINVVLMGVLAKLNIFPIAWEGHLGGFIGGFLAYIALEPRRSGPA